MALRETTVGEIADLLKEAKEGGPKACLMIGAGVSKTAGIGLAADFVARIKSKYPHIYRVTCDKMKGGKEPDYADCMDALPPARQVQLVREDIDKAKINWAHIGIARLECEEIIDSILTPNFDPLASRACALFHQFPAIYDLAGLRDDRARRIDFDRSFVKGSAIFHLHGQHTGFLLLNTEAKLKKQARRIRPVLDAVMKGKPVIIAGYSGGNDPLIGEIAALAPFNHGLFWVCRDGTDPAPNVCAQLLSQENCFVVRNMPADRFFTDLANALSLEPPKLMFSPFAHMLGVLETIECYSREGGSPQDNLLAQAKIQLQSAAKAAGRKRRAEIAKLMAAGQYDDVWKRFSGDAGSLDERDKNEVAWAGIGIANQLGDQAKNKSIKDARELFSRAYELYAAANEIRKDVPDSLYNWGVTLYHQSEIDRDHKDSLLLRAHEKYAAALEIKSDMHEALHNTGIVLTLLTQSQDEQTADDTFARAYEKFAAASKLKSDKYSVIGNWANALTMQGRRKKGTEAAKVYEKAGEKYAEVLRIRPDDPDTLNNWGILLAYQGQVHDGQEAASFYDHADEKYMQAEAILPGRSAYNRACLAALRGDAGLAAQLLREGNERGVFFPDCAHIHADRDFDTIRNTAEFQKAMKDIGCAPTSKRGPTKPKKQDQMAKGEQTGKKAGRSASKFLKDKRRGKDSKTAAGSALTQRPNKKKT